MNDFGKLEKELGFHFENKALLKQAFCHRSYLNEHPEFERGHNERLEFLGDAVLELVVTEHLFHTYPEKPEGELTSWRAALVNSKMLSEVARSLDFNDFLLLSKGEKKEKGKARNFILGDTFEAFLGALYLDQGYGKCRDFLKKWLLPKIEEVVREGLFKDDKSFFQEVAQEKAGITPTYEVLEEWGPDHDKRFLVGVYLGKKLVAKGEGSSKQEAEERAAERAIKIKNW